MEVEGSHPLEVEVEVEGEVEKPPWEYSLLRWGPWVGLRMLIRLC